jgi:chromate transport protein ChrA
MFMLGGGLVPAVGRILYIHQHSARFQRENFACESLTCTIPCHRHKHQGVQVVNPILAAAVHAVVGTVVIWLVLMAWKEEQKILDVAIASVGAALVTLVPTIGGPLSLLVMLGLLYWRCSTNLPAIAAAVALARLAMVPALMTLK